MLEGIEIRPIKRNNDKRGFFAEIFRQDWFEPIVQSNLSYSHPGVKRYWHRHARGQTDYFVVLSGDAEIMIMGENSIFSSGRDLQIVRVPGHYWHGFQVLGDKPALILYFTTKLYDYNNPDEERQ